jgi:ParB-like chromosome segregation protein Spo0J
MRPTKEEYEALKHSIETLGQTTPIEVNEEFEVLDGYSRLSALKELKKPKAKVVVKRFKNKVEEVWYVYSKNAIRRDLNTWQKIVATLKTTEEVLKIQGENTPLKEYLQQKGRPEKCRAPRYFRTGGIAGILGLSEDTVQRALYIYWNGTPELHHQLEEGQISIYEAYRKLKQQGQKQQPIQPQKKQTSDKISIYKHAIITCPHCHKPFVLREVL